MKKTLFCFTLIGDHEMFFFEKQGDFRHLDGVFINDNKSKYEDELAAITLDNNDEYLVEKLTEPTKDWDFFVKCGMIQ